MGLPAAVAVDADWNEFDHQDVLRASDSRLLSAEATRAVVMKMADPARAFGQLFTRAVERWASGQYDTDYAESWGQFQQRVNAALARASAPVREGEAIVIVTSAGSPRFRAASTR